MAVTNKAFDLAKLIICKVICVERTVKVLVEIVGKGVAQSAH